MRAALLLLSLSSLACSCTSVGTASTGAGTHPAPQELPEPPSFVREGTDEWVRLSSGEWLRGEITALVRGMLELDSEELDELRLDWDDVSGLYTTRPFTVLLEDRTKATGALRVEDELVIVSTPQGERWFARDQVQRAVPGVPGERNYWSGTLRLGFTARRGNTDQTDTAATVSAKRRTPESRLELAFDAVHSDADGDEIANTQHLFGRFDRFVTSRLYLTLLGVDVLRDRFQNIDVQVSPYLAVGYTFVDRGTLEWNGSVGAGYRYTRFASVQTGSPEDDDIAIAIVGTGVTSDLTEKLELEAAYQAQLGIEDLRDTNQSAWLATSYDLFSDLDFDVRVSWTRIGAPETDGGGTAPEKDDLRFDVGLAWSF